MSDQDKDQPADEGTTFSVGELIYDSYKKVESALESLTGAVNDVVDTVEAIADEAKDQIETLKQEMATVKESLDSIAASVEEHKNSAVEKLDEVKQNITEAVDIISGVADFVSEAWGECEGGPVLELGERSKSTENQVAGEYSVETSKVNSDEDRQKEHFLLNYLSGVNH